ncbi:uncharacterized protein LOC128553226 [Mercenaria mercenaria]|uniref:uncharacterized protein LOC128553226 n=1 Tax=Mercenaria mercenaria TaxID=6596 RepID=UPI00234F1CEA|nr:uncharacterized protein LOC128553226 [Mercenaria mercenaria]
MNVCVSCMRNSYCNPIRCHSCDTIVTPTIGHGWAALLIAGNDERDSVAKSFTDDVKAIHKVITSKCPLVMGVSADHVETVYPDEPGKPDSMLDKLKKSVHTLKNIDGIQTLLVYFSGHYKPNKGGFELSHCKMEERELQRKFEYLSKKDFEGDIASILHQPNSVGEPSSVSKRVIVLLDCCEAPAVTTPSQEEIHTLDKNITIVQINACRPNQKSIQEQDGSVFRKFLIQGLTRKALGKRCLNDPDCRLDDCYIQGNFVTFANLNDYISDHLKSFKTKHSFDCAMHTYDVTKIDAMIGYAINFNADLEFKYKFKEAVVEYDVIPQRMFSELRELQTLLFHKFISKCTRIFCDTLLIYCTITTRRLKGKSQINASSYPCLN